MLNRMLNRIKILGYCPIIGTFVGIAHLAMLVEIDGVRMLGPLPNKFNHIVRATIEFLSLGFLLIIPDIIITIHRSNEAKKAALA